MLTNIHSNCLFYISLQVSTRSIRHSEWIFFVCYDSYSIKIVNIILHKKESIFFVSLFGIIDYKNFFVNSKKNDKNMLIYLQMITFTKYYTYTNAHISKTKFI